MEEKHVSIWSCCTSKRTFKLHKVCGLSPQKKWQFNNQRLLLYYKKLKLPLFQHSKMEADFSEQKGKKKVRTLGGITIREVLKKYNPLWNISFISQE